MLAGPLSLTDFEIVQTLGQFVADMMCIKYLIGYDALQAEGHMHPISDLLNEPEKSVAALTFNAQ